MAKNDMEFYQAEACDFKEAIRPSKEKISCKDKREPKLTLFIFHPHRGRNKDGRKNNKKDSIQLRTD